MALHAPRLQFMRLLRNLSRCFSTPIRGVGVRAIAGWGEDCCGMGVRAIARRGEDCGGVGVRAVAMKLKSLHHCKTPGSCFKQLGHNETTTRAHRGHCVRASQSGHHAIMRHLRCSTWRCLIVVRLLRSCLQLLNGCLLVLLGRAPAGIGAASTTDRCSKAFVVFR